MLNLSRYSEVLLFIFNTSTQLETKQQAEIIILSILRD